MMTMATHAMANGGWGAGHWWPIFPIFWLLLWGALIFAFFRSRRGWGRWHQTSSPQDVLAERYARGEISEQEYRERLAVLKATA
ncbi:MAG: putative rane protein [Actinomycetota bacterium]|jgi:putative membrane protein|nr:putative rane protein [Actinomycetota bacterium]